MQIILLQDVRGVGKKFEVKNVSDGYVRNFLLPRGLVKPVTPQNLAEIKAIQQQQSQIASASAERLAELSRTLNGLKLKFTVKTDPTGSMFGSVSSDMILKKLRSEGLLGKERVEVKLEHPLKTLGEHQVEVDLKNGTKINLVAVLENQLI